MMLVPVSVEVSGVCAGTEGFPLLHQRVTSWLQRAGLSCKPGERAVFVWTLVSVMWVSLGAGWAVLPSPSQPGQAEPQLSPVGEAPTQQGPALHSPAANCTDALCQSFSCPSCFIFTPGNSMAVWIGFTLQRSEEQLCKIS